MRTHTKKILISDEDGNQIEVLAECIDIKGTDNLDVLTGDNGYSVKSVWINGNKVSVGIDGYFYHPDTRVLYSI
ncbi:hypothetical protein [uncultured Acinetobacter sp.]|uniref:hypothetical protein n=1 Tax=uncultured Acinetobacter sp. TaxID=165433 RepID=UPI0025848DBC|nr:hypothetical protein [uncultured Acinetobacter sp.]